MKKRLSRPRLESSDEDGLNKSSEVVQTSDISTDGPSTDNSPVEGALDILAPGPSEALMGTLPQTSSATPLELFDDSGI
jgi:hypothetical protein